MNKKRKKCPPADRKCIAEVRFFQKGRRKFSSPAACRSFLKRLSSRGLSISESIVVVAILAVIMTATFTFLKPRLQIANAQDARRKTDLQKIAKALEDYASDHECYPATIYTSGGSCLPSGEFSYYYSKIPCDPGGGTPYYYYRDPSDCRHYALYANLENGGSDYGDYNYAIASSNWTLVPTVQPGSGTGGSFPPPAGPAADMGY